MFKSYKNLKHYSDVILSLSISHLHDCSNFFALLKQDLHELKSKVKDPELQEILNDKYNFTRGAAYHFRSIFEELKKGKEIFDLNEEGNLSAQYFEILYSKEQLDLKDLLDLELFQISNLKKLNIHDDCRSPRAVTYGNFSLLSKLIINLIENALKYTEDHVDLKLDEDELEWIISIKSYGSVISDDVINKIFKQEHTGHGLSSVLDIVNYHNANLDINTLPTEGTNITLRFRKDLPKYSFNNVQSSNQIVDDNPFVKYLPKKILQKIKIDKNIIVTACLSILCLSIITLSNLKVNSSVETFISKLDEAKAENFIYSTLLNLKNEYSKINTLDSKDQIIQASKEVDALQSIFYGKSSNPNLLKLIVLNFNLYSIDADKHYILKKQIKELAHYYPFSTDLNYMLFEHYLEKGNLLNSTIYSLRIFVSIVYNFISPSYELKVAHEIFDNREFSYKNLAKVVSSLTNVNSQIPSHSDFAVQTADETETKEEQKKESKNAFNLFARPKSRIQKSKSKKVSKAKNAEYSRLNEMIEEQDKALGLDFDL